MQKGRQPKNVEVKSIFNILDKCFYLLASMINRCSFTGKRARYDPMTAVKLMASAGAAGQPAQLCFFVVAVGVGWRGGVADVKKTLGSGVVDRPAPISFGGFEVLRRRQKLRILSMNVWYDSSQASLAKDRNLSKKKGSTNRSCLDENSSKKEF